MGEEDIVLDAATQGSNLNWPDEIHANDMFIVLGTVERRLPKVDSRRGDQRADERYVVGTTLDGRAEDRPVPVRHHHAARCDWQGLPAGNFFIQSQAADTDGHVEIWRFRKNRV